MICDICGGIMTFNGKYYHCNIRKACRRRIAVEWGGNDDEV